MTKTIILPDTEAPRISALPADESRPFWSVMIPVYNRTTYLQRTLESVLCQDPGPRDLQIEVVDDASTTEDPEPLVKRLFGDRVKFSRQHKRLGGVGNWNSCIERAVGQWVHILHSDDLVLPGFYARLKGALEKRSDVGAAFCRHKGIDENDGLIWTEKLEAPTPGVLPDFIEKLGVSQRIQCPSIVVKREVYEALGGFRPEVSFAADWEMWIRISAFYPIWYEPEILAAFRSHSASWTSTCVRTASNIADEQRCIALVRPLLPRDRAEIISRKAREQASLRAVEFAYRAMLHRQVVTAFRQVSAAVKCCFSPRVIMAMLAAFPRAVIAGTRRAGAISKRWVTRTGTSLSAIAVDSGNAHGDTPARKAVKNGRGESDL